ENLSPAQAVTFFGLAVAPAARAERPAENSKNARIWLAAEWCGYRKGESGASRPSAGRTRENTDVAAFPITMPDSCRSDPLMDRSQRTTKSLLSASVTPCIGTRRIAAAAETTIWVFYG